MSSDIPLKSVGEARKRKPTGTDPKNEDAENSSQTPESKGDNGIPKGFNKYHNKKMLTQGLINLSLLSSNANQLRFILEHGSKATAPCYILAACIILSLVLQIGAGVLLILSSRHKFDDDKDKQEEIFKNGDKSVVVNFLITVINIFIVTFGGSIDVKSSGSSSFSVNSTTPIISAVN